MENLKHTKQYAEKLADTHLVHISDEWSKASFVVGYMRAIEETASPQLLEALLKLQYAVKHGGVKGLFEDEIKLIDNAINKAIGHEQNSN